MPQSQQVQVTFAGGANPAVPTHLITPEQVVTATNIDFSLINGALAPRQGSYKRATASTVALGTIFVNYNSASALLTGPSYVSDAAGATFRGTGIGATSYTSILTGGAASTAFPNAIQSFENYTIVSGNGKQFKDDGTNVTDWIKASPGTPTVSTNTLTGIDVLGGDSWICTEGTLVSGTDTITFVNDGNPGIGAAISFTGTSTNLDLNGTYTVGGAGVHTFNIAFSDPAGVISVSYDYSIGDNTFDQYLHFEAGQFGNIGTLSSALLQQVATTTDTALLQSVNPYLTSQFNAITNFSNVLTNWQIPATNFQFIGNSLPTGDLFGTIGAVRLIVISTNTCTITIDNPQVYGAEKFPLTDNQVGYTYWQTFVSLDTNGNKLDESAVSNTSSGPTIIQNGNFSVSIPTNPAGTSGVNGVITYRQGGLMFSPFAVSTITYVGAASVSTFTSGTTTTTTTYGSTFTDTLSDIQALLQGFAITSNLFSKTTFPANISCICEPMADRIFFGSANILYWSLPGQIGSFPQSSFQEIARQGDNIQDILAFYPGLIVVNRESIYEMYGSDFETGQYTLLRIGANVGSVAKKTLIKTPFGVPLLNGDGLSIFTPGANAPAKIPWFENRYADIFKGSFIFSPATYKGARIPALNLSYIQESVACFSNNKLYIGMPTGTATLPNTLFVLDFTLQQAWHYTYPFNFTSLYNDTRNIGIYAGTDDGKVMQLEAGTVDQNTGGTNTGIVWYAKTKSWTAASHTVVENVMVDSVGNPIQVRALYDSTNTVTAGTLTNTDRHWSVPPLNGTFINEVVFDITGTCSVGTLTSTGILQAVYGLGFQMLSEPVPVRYWRTDYNNPDQQAGVLEGLQIADKLWDVEYYDLTVIGTDVVTAVTFIDNTAVMTATISGPTNGRIVQEQAFPPEIYGRIAYTTYTSTNTAVFFKPFETRYQVRPEPAKVNYYRSDIESLEENIVEAFDVDINPNGTTFGTAYVDNIAISTATITGTKRQSYTFDTPFTTYPINLYGRTFYVAYTGTGLKMYNTWFHKRLEPDRWSEYISPVVTGDEREIKVFKPEINPLGNTVLATTYLAGTAISTHTITGSVRLQYTFSLPVEKFSRSVHAAYRVVPTTGPGTDTNTGRFKHYTTEFEGPVEPPRVTLWRTGPYPYESNRFMKTWSPLLDPISGTVTGTLIVEDTIVNISTFTGNRRQWFTVGIDLETTNNFALFTGSRWEAVYSGTAQFKHYDTKLESDISPFKKATWSFHYKKLGGATQLDMGRFWSAYVDVPVGPIVGTYYWDIDNAPFVTGTLTFAQGRSWTDRISLPPGARGRLFEFRLYGPNNLEVYNVNMDMALEGIKGLTRRGKSGAPPDPEF